MMPVPVRWIMENVLHAMQDAEELDRPEGQEYVDRMEAIIDECRRRIETFRSHHGR
jgi:hypothetical protein